MNVPIATQLQLPPTLLQQPPLPLLFHTPPPAPPTAPPTPQAWAASRASPTPRCAPWPPAPAWPPAAWSPCTPQTCPTSHWQAGTVAPAAARALRAAPSHSHSSSTDPFPVCVSLTRADRRGAAAEGGGRRGRAAAAGGARSGAQRWRCWRGCWGWGRRVAAAGAVALCAGAGGGAGGVAGGAAWARRLGVQEIRV